KHEPGTKDLVSVHDELECASQPRCVQRRGDAHERRDVVGAETGHDPVEQEESLLREGEPPETVVFIPEDRLRWRGQLDLSFRSRKPTGAAPAAARAGTSGPRRLAAPSACGLMLFPGISFHHATLEQGRIDPYS